MTERASERASERLVERAEACGGFARARPSARDVEMNREPGQPVRAVEAEPWCNVKQ